MKGRGRIRFPGLVVVVASLASFSCASAPQSDIQAHDFGLYGSAWIPWLRKNPTVADFIVYQAGPARPLKLIRNDLQFASDSGMKVILTLKLDKFSVPDSAVGRGVPSLENFQRVLDHIEDLPLSAITIGEENVFWDGGSERLAGLYEALRQRYPKRRFFQWYSPSRNMNLPGLKWPVLPADGWVFDQYFMPGHVYSEYVKGIASIDAPKISIVWASPLWRPGEKNSESDFEWWDEDGWKLFYEQVRLNIDHNIPTAFFLYEFEDSGLRPIPMFRSQDTCTLGFLDSLLNQTIPALQTSVRLAALPAERPDWIPSGCR